MRGATKLSLCLSIHNCNFNPRTPCGVRRRTDNPCCNPSRNFNPRTPCGVRLLYVCDLSKTDRYFNPRTPCGVRPMIVSEKTLMCWNFNPRTPCGVRLKSQIEGMNMFSFQSTHPMRGATYNVWEVEEMAEISIHAPHAGCDLIIITSDNLTFTFQSTHPMRGATTIRGPPSPRLCRFQSTHPMRGATTAHRAVAVIPAISIHAPHAGCDPISPAATSSAQ